MAPASDPELGREADASRQRVVIVGAGVSGLAAAWELTRRRPDLDVVVLESSSAAGGKLQTAEVAGHLVDVGSESVLARRPEFAALCAEAGLSHRIVHPTGAAASIWTRGRLWPLPSGTLMGVPGSPAATFGILDAAQVLRAESERVGPPIETDLSVGEFVEQRVGAGVVDRLVEPLLSGVYAGHARRLSLQAAVPALWKAAVEGRSVVETARDAAARVVAGPVFAGYRGGLGSFVRSLTAELVAHGVDLRTSTTVRELGRDADGWRLTTGPTTRPEVIRAAGVVLTVPAAPAARLLSEVSPRAADLLGRVGYASVAIVSLALPRSAAAALLRGSGFLVPPVDGVDTKAATFSSAKWSWVEELSDSVVHLRASLGRAGEVAVLQRSDDELVALAVADLRRVVGPALPDPVDQHVQRWGGGIPQYAVGHLDRVGAIRTAVAAQPALRLAGAAYEGVGIPACIASGREAAHGIAEGLPTHVDGRGSQLRG